MSMISKGQMWASLLVVLALCSARTSAQLLELSGDQLLDAIEAARTGEPLLVEFYAKWDGTARARREVLAQLADAHVVKVARVEFYKHQHIAHRLGVRATRTVCMFHKGFTYRFDGKLNLGEINEFAKGGYLKAEHEPTPAKPSFVDNLVGFYQTASLDPKFLTTALHSHENAKYVFGTAAVLALISLVVFEVVAGYLVERAEAPKKNQAAKAAATRVEDDNDEEEDEDSESEAENEKTAAIRGRGKQARNSSNNKQQTATKRKAD